MIETSDLYKELFAAGAKTEVALAIGNGPELTDENGRALLFWNVAICVGAVPEGGLREDSLLSVEVRQQSMDSSGPGVGGAYSGSIDVVTLETDAEIPSQAVLRPYVRLTDGARTSEWVPQGVFFVDTRKTDFPDSLPQLTLQGYDAMLRAEQDYPESALQWPAADISILEEIAAAMQVTIDPRTRQRIDSGYLIQYPDGYSCREVLGEIAGMYGGNFVIGLTGALQLVTLWGDADLTDVSGDILGDYTLGGTLSWDRVELDLDDVVYLTAGTGDSTLRLDCVNGTLGIAEDLLGRLRGVTYQAYTAQKVLLDPAAELGDAVALPQDVGILFNSSRSLGPMCTAELEAPENEELNHEYPYASGEDRKQTRRYNQLRADVDELKSKMLQLEQT